MQEIIAVICAFIGAATLGGSILWMLYKDEIGPDTHVAKYQRRERNGDIVVRIYRR